MAGAARVVAMAEIALAVPTFVALRFLAAPYGRHARAGWGPSVSAPVGWLLMECPAPIVFAITYAAGAHRADATPLMFLVMWEVHYVHRAFIFPLRISREATRMPVTVMAMAITFNTVNAWLNARWISAVAYPADWLAGVRFVAGATLFFAGLWLNVWSDRALRRLRGPADAGYRIPRGGAFEWVSCPNYLGEIVEWAGWAVATWSLAGLAFAIYTVANLAPRAIAHHAWYRARFVEYPPRRRALIPLVL